MHVIACVRVTLVATESNCGKTNICDEHIPALVTDLHMCWILRNILQDVRRTTKIVQSELSVKCRPDWHTQWVGQALETEQMKEGGERETTNTIIKINHDKKTQINNRVSVAVFLYL